ncbi:putative UAA transporter family protein [Lyophyllum shimeji]|uniref:UAA transporter family protein n=1 Tax=Lyophyllum shimeji TaxID=47721 RepID=A0A9P3UHM8_LYOSH|nr:putative UAA transporter family protein [Lyophyllum shimeji]
MLASLLSDWFTTLSLVFGGCCSNAITLEQLTSSYPHAGSLITFFQFLLISLHGLPTHITWTRYGPRFKPRRIPLTPYLIQVSLFYFISLLNNAAFAYRIPMAVHIIFRSGGLIVSMLLGWIVVGKRYTLAQILSVLLVTLGVVLTTLSASSPGQPSPTVDTQSNPYTYATGIAILTLALLFSGFLGLVQDWTYSKYGRPTIPGQPGQSDGKEKETGTKTKTEESPAWQESMFYLHFLALPMFLSVRTDLLAQIQAINSGPRTSFSLPLLVHSALPFVTNSSFISFQSKTSPSSSSGTGVLLSIPTAYLPLLLNTLTQLVCVAGVHRLTTRVTALTVTLVLVVRKAVSLVLSVVGVGMMGPSKARGSAPEVDMVMMWTGAAMVLLGTVTYSLGSASRSHDVGKAVGKEKEIKRE